MQIEFLELPCAPSHDLIWNAEIETACTMDSIVWKFDLGLETPYFPLDDELRFQSIALALKQFSDVVWPSYKGKTYGLCLYRGTADFTQTFSWTEKQLANLRIWLEEQEMADSPQARRLFAADAFAIYFQMLSHRLPDEAPVLLLLDVQSIGSPSDALQIISKERFGHFVVALKDRGLSLDSLVWDDKIKERKIDATKGLVFPESADPRFDGLLKKHPDGKIVFEAFLTEEWEGLDQLIVLEGSMSSQGERKLKGFLATGGEIVTVQ